MFEGNGLSRSQVEDPVVGPLGTFKIFQFEMNMLALMVLLASPVVMWCLGSVLSVVGAFGLQNCETPWKPD